MIDVLLAKAREYVPEDKLDTLADAYLFAESAHEGQVLRLPERLDLTQFIPFVREPTIWSP